MTQFSPSVSSPGTDDLLAALNIVRAPIAVLGPDNSVVYANHAWAEAKGLERDRVTGVRPSEYYEGHRLAEFESLLRRVRETSRPVHFRDTWQGQAYETGIKPLENGRLLVVSNPVAAPAIGTLDGMASAEVVEIRHKSWGALSPLTDREREVLAHLASGKTIKRVADALGRSQKTVEGHRDSIYRKLGANSRAELATIAIQAGLTDPTPLGGDSSRN